MPIDPSSNLYFEAFGSANAKTIVFLHGGGAAGWMWREQVKALGQKYHCLAPDLPEAGQTTQAGAYSTESAAARVADLIRSQAHGGQAVVVGLSEGAQVTVAMLAASPEVMEKAFVSSAILLPLPGGWMYTRGLFAVSYRWFIAPLKNNDWWIHLNMQYSAGIPDEYYPEFKRSFQQSTEDSTTNMLYEGMHFHLPAGLEKAALPVLVVAGQHEYAQMKQSARLLVQTLPNATGRLLSLGSKSSLRQEHNWAMTAPVVFNAALQAWLEDAPLPQELLPLD
jgi:pimeloyl-ACP methyl ester carboxylesterase